VSGINKVGFDPAVHQICATCRDKLSELAQREFEFTRHKQHVLVTSQRLQNSTKVLRIKRVVCDRRRDRHTDWEHWILDGLTETGETKNGIGSFIILHDDDGRFHACGIMSKKYSLLCTQDELCTSLEETLGKFGLFLDSGLLEFWCSDYEIEP
jgi:hypothetical protein